MFSAALGGVCDVQRVRIIKEQPKGVLPRSRSCTQDLRAVLVSCIHLYRVCCPILMDKPDRSRSPPGGKLISNHGNLTS